MSEQLPNRRLGGRLQELDERLVRLEASLASDATLEDTLPESVDIARKLLRAHAEHAGKVMPLTNDLLACFKAFVKGDPSLNAVRDNIRELVFYRNCLDGNRRDALPVSAEKMAVRTARHVYLYLLSRCEQEGRLD